MSSEGLRSHATPVTDKSALSPTLTNASSKPRISFVIAVNGDPTSVALRLSNFVMSLPAPDVEVIVVCADCAEHRRPAWPSPVRTLTAPAGATCEELRRRGMAVAAGDIVLFQCDVSDIDEHRLKTLLRNTGETTALDRSKAAGARVRVHRDSQPRTSSTES